MAIGMIAVEVLGLLTLTGISVSTTREAEESQHWIETHEIEKLSALLQFEAAFGYEGVIHSLKNYILRGNPADRDQTASSLADGVGLGPAR